MKWLVANQYANHWYVCRIERLDFRHKTIYLSKTGKEIIGPYNNFGQLYFNSRRFAIQIVKQVDKNAKLVKNAIELFN
jgi:hypothetical protein